MIDERSVSVPKATGIEVIEMMTQEKTHFVSVWRTGDGYEAWCVSDNAGYVPIAKGMGKTPEHALQNLYVDYCGG